MGWAWMSMHRCECAPACLCKDAYSPWHLIAIKVANARAPRTSIDVQKTISGAEVDDVVDELPGPLIGHINRRHGRSCRYAQQNLQTIL